MEAGLPIALLLVVQLCKHPFNRGFLIESQSFCSLCGIKTYLLTIYNIKTIFVPLENNTLNILSKKLGMHRTYVWEYVKIHCLIPIFSGENHVFQTNDFQTLKIKLSKHTI